MAAASETPLAPTSSLEMEVRVYSYYRDAELRGSNLVYRLLRILKDDESQMFLSEHLSDETRHAWLWTERIKELGKAPVPITDGYQVRIGKRAGLPRKPIDLLALTVVVEQRALKRYQEHLKLEGVPERTLEVLRSVTKDEGWHIDWVRQKAREIAEAEGTPERYDEAIDRFRAIDREVWAEIKDIERRWLEAL
ncbi:MAG: ferritin-like domain-containing protein [Deltaproteobacteria bacterium]|nr:ferritin-like domain-containing protein [Deltaproteobacteria bacterium]MBW2393002.1 ferritin-like domain-containing protein [Deltaproteobacteria bacterium]